MWLSSINKEQNTAIYELRIYEKWNVEATVARPGLSSFAKAAPRPTLAGREPRTCLTLASVPCVSKDDAQALRPP